MTAAPEWSMDPEELDAWTRRVDGEADGPPGLRAVPGAGDERLQAFRARLLDRSQLADLPQPEPLIAGTLDRRTVALLEGRNSTGKSFIALDWACCVATGKPWQTRDVDDPGPVLYVAAEGAHGLHNRITAWETAWQQPVPTGAMSVLPTAVNLFTGRDFPQLHDVVAADAHRLVVIDTWARSTVGGKENDNSDSTAAFERVDALRALGATVLVLHHTDKADTSGRGASALEDNADTIYRVRGDDGLLELSREKRKDGPPDDRHLLQLRVLELPHKGPDGGYATSCVVQNSRGHESPLSGRAEELLSVFMSAFGTRGARKSELRAVAEQSPATFARGLKALLDQGLLVNKGTDALPRYVPGAAA